MTRPSKKTSGFWLRFCIPVLASLGLTPFLFCFGFFPGWGNHGSFGLPALILFPYTNLMLRNDLLHWSHLAWILPAIIQFPVYGIILGFANAKRKLIPAVFVVLAIHALGIGSLYASSYYARYKYWHNPTNQLIEAVRRDDVSTAKRLLEEGVDPNTKLSTGLSMLMLACMDGHLEMAKLFLEKGADINYVESDGGTAFFMAVTFGHEEIVQLLLEKDVDINRADFRGQTAIFHAVGLGNEKMVQFLLSKGAEVTVKDSNGNTVLEHAKELRESRLKRRKPRVYSTLDRERDERIISLVETAEKEQKKR